MKIQCTQLDNLLMEGDAYSMQLAEQHAAECPQCAPALASWKEISNTAHGMQTTWQNDMLWPRIERSLKKEKHPGLSWPLQIAAAVVLFAFLAAVVWKVNQLNRIDALIYKTDTLSQVEKAEREHIAAINRLEKLTDEKLDDPSTPLLVSYKEKLMLLDDAIAECQTAIDQNRRNAHLHKQLLAIYTEKQRTLQDVIREDNSVSHQ
jgi:hypothetical protein